MPTNDSRLYPTGLGGPKSRPINGTLVEFGVSKTQRTRVTLAQLNAGFDLLPAVPGVRWRVLDAEMIAVGGAATTGTSANLQGTRAGSIVQILAVAIAALTQSALVRLGAANAVILADGASLTQLDANKPISVKTVGAAMTVMTSLDVILQYVADPA